MNSYSHNERRAKEYTRGGTVVLVERMNNMTVAAFLYTKETQKPTELA